MTIASEITRLQTDKESIRQAIIDKGVDVAASVSFDDYAACIAAIPTGGGYAKFDYIVIGGGGGGYRGGGGGGEVITGSCIMEAGCLSITIGQGGKGRCQGAGVCETGGGNTCLGDIEARGGCAGTNTAGGGASGSGCSGGGYYSSTGNGGGGGGAGGNGEGASYSRGGSGGVGICGYGGGGAGKGCNRLSPVYDGGGEGGWCANRNGKDATKYGGGGGGGNPQNAYHSGNGYQGAVIVCHPEGCSYKISGQQNKYVCNGYCVYEFTCDGAMVVS